MTNEQWWEGEPFTEYVVGKRDGWRNVPAILLEERRLRTQEILKIVEEKIEETRAKTTNGGLADAFKTGVVYGLENLKNEIEKL